MLHIMLKNIMLISFYLSKLCYKQFSILLLFNILKALSYELCLSNSHRQTVKICIIRYLINGYEYLGHIDGSLMSETFCFFLIFDICFITRPLFARCNVSTAESSSTCI
jgi:hypothetical protein